MVTGFVNNLFTKTILKGKSQNHLHLRKYILCWTCYCIRCFRHFQLRSMTKHSVLVWQPSIINLSLAATARYKILAVIRFLKGIVMDDLQVVIKGYGC